MKSIRNQHIFLSVIAALLFIPFLGMSPLFDWDEINFAESAREMLLTGEYSLVQIDFEPFWEKPPLFFWLQVLSMKLFGVNEFAARLPNAIGGIITLNVLIYIGRIVRSHQFGILWALVYMASITPQFYFHSGIIDPWFNLFIILSLFFLVPRFNTLQSKYLSSALSGLFAGLALLTKGPVAAVIIAIVYLIYLLLSKEKIINLRQIGLAVLVFIGVSSVWFLPQIINDGFGFISSFIEYQLDLALHPVASHGQPWFYHILVLLLGCFPAAVLALPALLQRQKSESDLMLMKVFFFVVLTIFSLVTTKIVHYSSLCYYPLAFLAAYHLENRAKVRSGMTKFINTLLAALLVIWNLVFIGLPIIGYLSPRLAMRFEGKLPNSVLDILAVDGGWSVPVIGFSLLFIPISVWIYRLYVVKSSKLKSPFLVLAVFISGYVTLITPLIERQVQGEIIAFYKSLQGKDVYVRNVGFKSYAPPFYTRLQPYSNSDEIINQREIALQKLGVKNRLDLTAAERENYNHQIKNWLVESKVDKPTYLVCKENKKAYLKSKLNTEPIFAKGGYFVYLREPSDELDEMK